MIDNLQLNAEGRLKHFLSIEGLPKSLLTEILDIAESFVGIGDHQIKKVPLLRGKTIVNLFLKIVHAQERLLNWPLNDYLQMS